jgi:hypothetical protein
MFCERLVGSCVAIQEGPGGEQRAFELTKLLTRKAFEGKSLYTDYEVRAFVREIAGGRPVENNEVPSA